MRKGTKEMLESALVGALVWCVGMPLYHHYKQTHGRFISAHVEGLPLLFMDRTNKTLCYAGDYVAPSMSNDGHSVAIPEPYATYLKERGYRIPDIFDELASPSFDTQDVACTARVRDRSDVQREKEQAASALSTVNDLNERSDLK